jgi:DNA-binding cell septation regulator SpoVG
MSGDIEVSQVRIRFPKRDAGNIVGWASCVIDGDLQLNNIEILKGADGTPWLKFPTRTSRHGRVHHVFCPVNRTARAAIEKAVFDKLAAEGGPRANGGRA